VQAIPLRTHIETLQGEVSKKGGGTDFVLHGAALQGALSLTNGSRGNIESMSDQLALLTAVLVGDRLSEKARHLSECILAPQIHANPDGTPNYPWPTRKEVTDYISELRVDDQRLIADAKEASDAKSRSLVSTFKISKEGVSASGAVAYLTLLLVAAGIGLYFWGGHRDKAIEKSVATVVSTQVRAALTSAVNAEKASEAIRNENE